MPDGGRGQDSWGRSPAACERQPRWRPAAAAPGPGSSSSPPSADPTARSPSPWPRRDWSSATSDPESHRLKGQNHRLSGHMYGGGFILEALQVLRSSTICCCLQTHQPFTAIHSNSPMWSGVHTAHLLQLQEASLQLCDGVGPLRKLLLQFDHHHVVVDMRPEMNRKPTDG